MEQYGLAWRGGGSSLGGSALAQLGRAWAGEGTNCCERNEGQGEVWGCWMSHWRAWGVA